MDLTINLENQILNVRAGGVLIHNNKILCHYNSKSNHYCLIGGRIEIGETSKDAIIREVKEELDKEIEVIDYITTIENFFEMNDKKYHEIMFVYKIEFTNEQDKKIEYELQNKENKNYLKYKWVDIDKIEEYKLYPSVLKNLLKQNNFKNHIIHID